MDVLHGTRVVDLGNFITGPYATMLLGEQGADVIKIERRGVGDPFRGFEEGLYSPQFQSHNRHKRSVAVDITKPEGVALVHHILKSAAVVVLNNRPGVSERIGFGYETLHELNPRLVYCSITGFGPDGPYATRPAYDNVGQTLSGWLSLFHLGADPRIAGPAVVDAITGIFACLGIMGALIERTHSGVGRRVDVSMLEAALAFGNEPIGHYLSTGKRPGPYARGAMSQAYILACKDGKRIGLHMSSPEKFWEGLAKAIGRPDLLQKHPGRAARVENYREIAEELARVFATRPREEWISLLEENDVPFAPERLIDELEDDPQIQHLGMVRETVHPKYGSLRSLARPIRYDGKREETMLPPPDLGEHTEEVLREVGKSGQEIEELRQKGVI